MNIALSKQEVYQLLSYSLDAIDALKNTLNLFIEGNEANLNQSLIPVFNFLQRASDQAYLEMKQLIGIKND